MTFLSVCTVAVAAMLGQGGGFGSVKVAVVDIPAVSERYQRTGELEAQFEQRRLKFNERRDAQQQRIERLGRSLQEEFKPGTNEFEERRKQLVLLEAELRWFVESEGQKIEEGLAGSLRDIYADIRETVRIVAEEMGVDVVLAADRLPTGVPRSTTQARQQIVLQKVVYWNPRVDLTDEVVTRVNAAYKARRLTPPSGGVRPPSAEDAIMPLDPSGQPPGSGGR